MGIYLKSRLTRSALGYVTALLLTVFSVFGCFYSWLIESKEAERESAYSLPSEVVIASVTGTSTEDLDIMGPGLRAFTRYKSGFDAMNLPDLRPYFSDIRIEERLAYGTLAQTGVHLLRGISSMSMFGGDEIIWLDGELDLEDYDSEGIIIPEEIYSSLTDDSDILRMTVYPNEETTNRFAVCELKIAGYYTGGDKTTIYCPFEQAMRIMTEIEGFYGSGFSISATVADNKKLDELRELLPQYFCEVTPSGNVGESPLGYEYRHSAIIHDEELRKTINTLSRSISLLKRLYPIILSAEIIIAAAACWFYKHLSRREIAVARSLGTPASAILSETAVEMLILSLMSVLIATVLAALLPICVIDPAVLAIIPASGIAGAFVSAFTSAKNNGTLILKED